MKVNKKVLKRIIALAVICCMALPIVSNAAHSYRVQGKLKTSVHYVPVLKDTVTASTSITNPCKFSTAASKTYSYAYDKSGKYNVVYAEAFGVQAVESWSVGHAKASIRAMVKAKGVHKAKSDCTNNKWVTVNTSWKK